MMFAGGAWGVAAALLIAAVTVFLMRPTMGDLQSRLSDREEGEGESTQTAAAAFDASGAHVCTLDRDLSRITVSQPEPVEFEWSSEGCRDGDIQYGEAEDGVWQRPFVSGDEPVVDVDSFDTNRGTYTIMRYQMSAAALTQARQIRARYRDGSCEGPQGALDLSGEMDELLPQSANEYLVYHCDGEEEGAE